jgi:preprotein translocase subunit YajC
MDILFLQAPASTAVAASSGNGWVSILFWAAAFGVIWYFMIRPQGQLRKQQEEFKNSLKKGTKVVTMGGIHGVILNLNEKTIELMIAPKVAITVQRDSISVEYTKSVNAIYNDANTETKDKQPIAENATVQPDSEK